MVRFLKRLPVVTRVPGTATGRSAKPDRGFDSPRASNLLRWLEWTGVRLLSGINAGSNPAGAPIARRSSAGRARGSYPGGRRFESCRRDQYGELIRRGAARFAKPSVGTHENRALNSPPNAGLGYIGGCASVFQTEEASSIPRGPLQFGPLVYWLAISGLQPEGSGSKPLGATTTGAWRSRQRSAL